MHRTRTRVVVGALVLAASTTIAASPALGGNQPESAVATTNNSNRGPRAHGLTDDGRIVRFDTNRPQWARSVGKVRNLQGDTRLVGIDVRVQDGKLYGVGDKGGIYTISTRDAYAKKVSQLTVALSGTSFGVDFNPAADRLRVVSDNGQNLRHDVNPGGVTVADLTLTYPPATTPVTGVSGAAYTNNDLDPNTATTLFDLDAALDQIAIQAPANSGQLSPTGKLGVDATGDVGFDIFSRTDDGTTVGNRAFAALSSGGSSTLYRITLLTGAADERGDFPDRYDVIDIAVELDK